jgi:hypothetical protein
LSHEGHEQRQRLALAAGKAANRIVQAVFQSHVERADAVAQLATQFAVQRPAQSARLAAPRRQRQVLGDGHVRRGAAEGILKNAANEFGAPVLGPARDVASRD